MSVAFSSDGVAVMSRNVDTLYTAGNDLTTDTAVSSRTGLSEAPSDSTLSGYFQLDECVAWINNNGYKCVAIQFPDELLSRSVPVYDFLTKTTTATIFILGDTSFGSCCVDEVAASHYSADSIIHFGVSCLSRTHRLPVLYVFGRLPIDGVDFHDKFRDLFPALDSHVIVMFDVQYSYYIDSLLIDLQEHYTNLLCSRLNIPDICETVDSSQYPSEALSHHRICRCGRIIELPTGTELKQYQILYIGHEGPSLNTLIMNFNANQFYTYNPQSKVLRKETLNVNRSLMRRYYMIERAKDARIVAIVVGTTGVSQYREVIARLKDIITRAGKKCYTLLVGKLNPAKLGNFLEVDVFVYVSCSQSSLVDSADYYRPIITPYELELACNRNRDWTGDYVTEYIQILPGGSHYIEMSSGGGDDVDVSLITGQTRSLGVRDDPDVGAEAGSALVPRNDALTVSTLSAGTAGEFLANRTWTGLEKQLGQTPVSRAVDGDTGIASGYSKEIEHS